MYVLMEGNLSDGYQAVGPFKVWEDAKTYRDQRRLCGWVLKVYEPEQSYPKREDTTDGNDSAV